MCSRLQRKNRSVQKFIDLFQVKWTISFESNKDREKCWFFGIYFNKLPNYWHSEVQWTIFNVFSIKRRKKWWTLKKIKNLCGIVGLVKINLKKYIPKYLIVEQFIKGLNEQEKNLADFAEISDLEVSNYMKLFFSTNRVPTNGMFGSLSSRFPERLDPKFRLNLWDFFLVR